MPEPASRVRGARPHEDEASGGRLRLTLDELLQAVEIVDAHVDSAMSPPYQEQPLAQTWARVTKVASEAGEAIDALSACTGENFRRGICGTRDAVLGELGDAVSAAMCAIQHLTKDTGATWAVVSAAVEKARRRVAQHSAPARQEAAGG